MKRINKKDKTENDNIKSIFHINSVYDVILNAEGVNILELSKISNITNSHVSMLIKICVKYGIIWRVMKDGREWEINLTSKGLKIKRLIVELKRIIQDLEQNKNGV